METDQHTVQLWYPQLFSELRWWFFPTLNNESFNCSLLLRRAFWGMSIDNFSFSSIFLVMKLDSALAESNIYNRLLQTSKSICIYLKVYISIITTCSPKGLVSTWELAQFFFSLTSLTLLFTSHLNICCLKQNLCGISVLRLCTMWASAFIYKWSIFQFWSFDFCYYFSRFSGIYFFEVWSNGKFYFIRMASTFSGIFNNMIRLNGNFDFERELDTIIGRLI